MESIVVSGLVSYIDPDLCSGCFACVNVCPYGAISFNEKERVAEVNQLLCKGCGLCAVTCPSEVPILMGFNNNQLYAQINSALAA
jgi:heterodisulfide reductase subunit A